MTVSRCMSHPRVLVSVCIDRGETPGAALLVVRTGPKRGARFELPTCSDTVFHLFGLLLLMLMPVSELG